MPKVPPSLSFSSLLSHKSLPFDLSPKTKLNLIPSFPIIFPPPFPLLQAAKNVLEIGGDDLWPPQV